MRCLGWSRSATIAATLSTLLSYTTHGQAYNAQTHQEIVNLSWQVMRATSDPHFAEYVFGGTLPAGLTSLQQSTQCASGDVTCQAAWTAFVERIRRDLPKLNAAEVSLDVPSGCTYGTTQNIKDFPDALAPGHTVDGHSGTPKSEQLPAA
jgi:hypothetical protein